MLLTEKEILTNLRYFVGCAKIINISNKITIKKLAKRMGYLQSNPNFPLLVRFLRENNFVEIDKERLPYLININQKKLALFLRKSEFFKLCCYIIEKTTIGYRY